jgi:hypothetical protein
LHSSLDDPEYINDLNYYNKGLDLTKVKELAPRNTFARKYNSVLPCTYYRPTIWKDISKLTFRNIYRLYSNLSEFQ